MAFHLRFNIGIITETHLTTEEMGALTFRGYTIEGKWGTNKQLGGVMIMVDEATKCRKLENISRPREPIDVCAILLLPTGNEDYQIRLTGIYIPPSAKATAVDLESLTAEEQQSTDGNGQPLSHLLVGDFNPNCWKSGDDSLYQEWIAECGLWELSHPRETTYKTGSVLDKFLLRIGKDIPEEWIGSPTEEDEAHQAATPVSEGASEVFSRRSRSRTRG